jgi:type IV pilus assembly protein PilC
VPAFQYKAIGREGQPARGSLDAVNEIDLELRLRRMGLDLVTARQVEPGTRIARTGKITRRDLIGFCFDMEMMARSGISLMDGLRDLRDSIDNPRFKEVLASVIEDMEGGKVLSQAMESHPDTFASVFVSLVRAGEQAGKVPEVFQNLGANLKWQDELASQTKQLLIYPAMVLVVVALVFSFLLIYLVPKVTLLLTTMGVALPFQTRMLIFVSNFVIAWWPVIFGLPTLIAVVLIVAINRNQRAHYLWDYAKLRIPVIGPILQKIILSRFANFFALMYQSGITILDALKTSEDIVGNRVISDGIMRAREQINAGEGMTETFQNLGLFPPLVIRMLRVGESTGALDTALMNVTYFYNRDVKESVDKGMALIGPVLTVVLGSALALVIWAVMGPIYDIFGKLKL